MGVFDEADRMIEAGHFKEVDDILKCISGNLERGSKQLQTFVFSATLTLEQIKGRGKGKGKGKSKDKEEKESLNEKVSRMMEKIKFKEPKQVHTVDLTNPETEKRERRRRQAEG